MAGDTGAFVLTLEWAQAFAREWIESWNSHDLDRVLSHYADDFEMRSPLIQERRIDPSGVLRGKKQVRAYWAKALQTAPPVKFELRSVYVGASSLAIAYRSVGRALVTEVVVFNSAGQVVSANALYGARESQSG
jgi:ketosteroid isomerase-like protein